MQKLKKLLSDTDVEIRREAIESIRGKADRKYINILLNAMKDPSWRIRNTAVDILLEEYPVESYVEGLIQLLYCEDNAGARNSAIEALIKLNKKATPHLIKAFNTTNRDVRKFIIDILGEFIDDRSFPLMLNAIKDEDENVRATAIEHIGKIGTPTVVDILIEIIESGDLWTAYPATDALGRIGNKKAIPVLIKTLDKKTLRVPAIKSLSLISDPFTLQYIIPFMKDPSKTVQEETLLAIEKFYHNGVSEDLITNEIKRLIGDEAIEILSNHIWSKRPEVKISAILILGLLKDIKAFKPLLEISQEDDFIEDIKRAFIFIGKNNPESLIDLFETNNIYKKRFICEIAGTIASPAYYPYFKEFLKDEDGHIRAISALSLSRIGNEEAIEPITALLSDPYEDVQEAAVEALSNFGSKLDVNEFISMLNAQNPSLRKNAALILGRIGAVEAIPSLGFALKDEDVAVRKACVNAFSMLKTEESVKFLIYALTDEDPQIRTCSILSLGQIGGDEVYDALSLLISDKDESVRVAVAKAFGLLKDSRAIKPLINLLIDKNGFVVTAAIESLSIIGGKDARSALLKMLSHEDREIRRTTIKALASFNNIENFLIPFLKDPDWATRKAAVETLSKSSKEFVKKELQKLYESEEDPIVKEAIDKGIKEINSH